MMKLPAARLIAPLWNVPTAATGFGFAGEDAGLAAMANSEAVAGTLTSQVTLGGLLSSVGLGFGAGSLLNSALGGHTAGGTAGSCIGAFGGPPLGQYRARKR